MLIGVVIRRPVRVQECPTFMQLLANPLQGQFHHRYPTAIYLTVQIIQQYFGPTGSFRLKDTSAIVSETFLPRKVADPLAKR